VLKSLIRDLPPEFIQTFKDCEDKRILRTLGREKLLEIIKLNSITKRREAINKILKNTPPSIPLINPYSSSTAPFKLPFHHSAGLQLINSFRANSRYSLGTFSPLTGFSNAISIIQ
jgi:hypothetical protein